MNRKSAVVGVMALLLLAGLLWAVRGYQAQRRLALVKVMSQQLRDAQALTPQQRQAKWAEFRKEVTGLSAEQRRELSAERRKAATEKLRRFFQLPRREQLAKLDQDIKRAEQRRREFDRVAAGQAKAGFGPGAWGGAANARRPGDRDQRARQWLDHTTPEERALYAQYRQAIDDRRRQIGLPPSRRGGPR